MTLKLRLLFLPPGKTRGQGPAAAPHRARCGSSLRPEGRGLQLLLTESVRCGSSLRPEGRGLQLLLTEREAVPH